MPGRCPEDFAAGLEDCCHFLAYSSKSGGSGPLVLKGRAAADGAMCYQRLPEPPVWNCRLERFDIRARRQGGPRCSLLSEIACSTLTGGNSPGGLRPFR
jgi:hypothetical protein